MSYDDRIDHIFAFMEYDQLTERQYDFIISLERHYKQWGRLSLKQYEALEDIFKYASERA